MRPLRRTAAPIVLLLLVACGRPTPGPGSTLAAAGTGDAEVAPVPTPTTTSTSTTAAPRPTSTTTTTTARRTTTTTRPATALATPAPGAPYAPPPPPPGVQADGYGGYGGLTSVSDGTTTVSLRVYPREQYFGETMQVWVNVSHTEAVTAFTLDFGNGHAVTLPAAGYWPCSRAPRDAGGSQWYVYPAAGQYRITATVTVTPCQILPGPPGGWTNPDGSPAVNFPEPWIPTGPAHTVSAAMDILQRADAPPRPVGPPPGP